MNEEHFAPRESHQQQKAESLHLICATPWFTVSVLLNTHCQVLTRVVSVSTRNIAASQKTSWRYSMRYHRAKFILFSCTWHNTFLKVPKLFFVFLIDVYGYNSYYTNYSDSKNPAKRFSCTIKILLFWRNFIYFKLNFFPVFSISAAWKKPVIYKQSSFLSTSETVARHNSKVWSSAWFAQC